MSSYRGIRLATSQNAAVAKIYIAVHEGCGVAARHRLDEHAQPDWITVATTWCI
jgi:hypothetical protein